MKNRFDYIHSLKVNVAIDVGPLAALVYNHIFYWINENLINGRAQKDGKTWTYQSHSTMLKYLPYLTEKQIKSSLEILYEKGYIIKGNFNENKFDRTTWYSLPDEIPNNVFEEPCRADEEIIENKIQKKISISPVGLMDDPSRADVSYNIETGKKTGKQQQQEKDDCCCCSLDSEFLEKKELLLKYQASEEMIQEFKETSLRRIKNATEALEEAEGKGKLENPVGFLREAIRKGWGKSEVKPKINQEEENNKKISMIEKVKSECKKLEESFESLFTFKCKFAVRETCLDLISPTTTTILSFLDAKCLPSLKGFIKMYFQPNFIGQT